jgi:hypothetical protein
MRWWWALLFAVLVFHSTDGTPVYIVDSQIVAIRSAKGYGFDGPTLILLMSGSAVVRESPEDVAKQLGWKP